MISQKKKIIKWVDGRTWQPCVDDVINHTGTATQIVGRLTEIVDQSTEDTLCVSHEIAYYA